MTLKKHWEVSYKTKLTLNTITQHLLLDVREMKVYVHKKTYKKMFRAGLFIITKIWHQFRYLDGGIWVLTA